MNGPFVTRIDLHQLSLRVRVEQEGEAHVRENIGCSVAAINVRNFVYI